MIALPVVDALDSVTIPTPCPVPWESMGGDDRTRFCDQCNQNVHDVSELTREEALQLVTGEARTCVRLFRRPDGRVMTADCLTRRERAWKWLHRRSAWAAALFALVFMVGCGRTTEIAGGICPIDPPPSELPPSSHDAEHERRAARAGDHVAHASGMNPEARAEAERDHESAAGR